MAKRLKKKEFIVIGMGKFGQSIARALADSGCDVLAVDNNEENIREIAEDVTHAMVINITDADDFATLGVKNFDAAVIAIGSNMETSVMCTILAKEAGVPYILAKANSELHAKILRKVGADLAILPEREIGIRMANRLVMGQYFDATEITSTFSMMELPVPEKWAGQTLVQLNLRAKKKINVIAIKKPDGRIEVNPDANAAIEPDDTLVVIGKNDRLQVLAEEETENR